MNKQKASKRVHVLNGDVLKDHFPSSLESELIVLRECLVEGDVSGAHPVDIFESRKTFFSQSYGISNDEYTNKSQREIEKINNIPSDAEVSLWFEDDLFCQVNLWFSVYLLDQGGVAQHVSLVRPGTSLELGFGGLNRQGLINAFEQRLKLNSNEAEDLSELWRLYQKDEIDKMKKIGEKNSKAMPFLLPAIEAHERRMSNTGQGEPYEIISALVKEYGKDDFGIIFRKFFNSAPIYGFGDTQVKRIFNKVIRDGTTQS